MRPVDPRDRLYGSPNPNDVHFEQLHNRRNFFASRIRAYNDMLYSLANGGPVLYETGVVRAPDAGFAQSKTLLTAPVLRERVADCTANVAQIDEEITLLKLSILGDEIKL